MKKFTSFVEAAEKIDRWIGIVLQPLIKKR